MAALVGCAALRTSPPPPFLFPAALTRERRRPQPQVNPGAPPAHGGGRWAALTAPPGGRREGEANPRATASTTTRRVGEINAAGGRSWWRSARSGRRARGPRRAWRWCGPWLRAGGRVAGRRERPRQPYTGARRPRLWGSATARYSARRAARSRRWTTGLRRVSGGCSRRQGEPLLFRSQRRCRTTVRRAMRRCHPCAPRCHRSTEAL